ncbi:turripeptide OL11 [Biomphalaria glabrata]|uniref:Kazal-like domain-containing protein n=1 Tax=Biomphalaria glabrata TaxID=6526 RepID=A0A2C9JRV2_BIOGL|nr:turripeptide OL11 [Biomphalaria glabrata]
MKVAAIFVLVAVVTQYALAANVNRNLCNKVCTTLYDPVCGSDGETYVNLCSLNALNCNRPYGVRALYQGECKKKKPVYQSYSGY